MKAILVIDLPNSCVECPLCSDGQCDAMGVYLEDVFNQKHEWCPLKPMPETRDVGYPIDDYAVGFSDGWDALLREITE